MGRVETRVDPAQTMDSYQNCIFLIQLQDFEIDYLIERWRVPVFKTVEDCQDCCKYVLIVIWVVDT